MRSGTINGRQLRRQQRQRPPVSLLPLIGLLALALMAGLWVVNSLLPGDLAGLAATGATPTAAAAAPSVTPTLRPVLTRPPTAKPTDTPSPTPVPTPTLLPTSAPTLAPPPIPSPLPTLAPLPTTQPTPAEPTPPVYGLLILDPADGSSVSGGGVTVDGLASPGAAITWDRPLWLDGHTTADVSGHWSFVIGLNPGTNVLTFRVGDDAATATSITVNYSP
jgi:hypothetical protein